MVDRQPGAAVGGEADAEHHALQRRLGQLGDHRGGLRIGRGVQRQEHRVEVAAAGQPLLGIEQQLLVVFGAGRHPRQPAHAVDRIALAAVHDQRPEAVRRAGFIGRAEPGFAAVGVDLGLAGEDAAGRIAPGREGAQRPGLGGVPGLLVEGLAGAQRPAGADGVALRLGGGVLGDRPAEVDLHAAHPRQRAGLDRDPDLSRRLAAGRLAQLQRQGGREVAQGVEQFARIGLGRHHQPRDLDRAEVVELAKALDLEVAFEELAHRGRLGLDIDRECRAGSAARARHGPGVASDSAASFWGNRLQPDSRRAAANKNAGHHAGA